MNQNLLLNHFDNSRFSRFHIVLMLLAGSCWTLAAYGVTIVGFLLPSLHEEWQVSTGALGLVASMGMIGMLIGAVASGSLSDHFGRRKTLIWSLVFLGIIFIISSYAWNYNTLLVMRLLTGIGLGAIQTSASTLLTEFSPAKHRGAMAVVMATCWGFGGTLSALVGYSLVLTHGWRPAMLIGGLSLFISILVHFLLPESIRFLLEKGRIDEAKSELSKCRLQIVIPHQTSVANIESLERTVSNTTGGIWSQGYNRITFSLWFLWIAINIHYQGTFIWLPTLLANTTRFSEGRSYFLTMIISLGQLPGTLIVAYLADRMSRKKLMITSLTLLSVATFIFSLVQSDAWLLISGFILMVSSGMTWGIAFPFSTELYPTRMRGAATGWATGIGRLGGATAPVFIGWIIQAGGTFNHIFPMLALVPFLTTLFLTGIKKETTGKSLEEISNG